MTWANQVRILVENFKALGSVVGRTLINALKPFVSALNFVIEKVISFAQIVSSALGAIFGWEYQVGGGGTSSIADDLEAGASAADGIADGMGGAADNAKKLRDYTLGIDELNIIKPDTDTSSGGGSGGSGGGAGGGANADGGQWVQTETLFEKYKSSINSLFELGSYIGDTLSKTMEDIDWNSIYQKASNFGNGLASFLNGLISPRLFGNVGTTIANSLNTVVQSALSFGQEFDFANFGASIGTAVTNFFVNFDFGNLAQTLNTWSHGLLEALEETVKNTDFSEILLSIGEFFKEIDVGTLTLVIGAFAFKHNAKAITKTLLTSEFMKSIGILASTGSVNATLASIIITIGSIAFTPLGMEVGDDLIAGFEEIIQAKFGDSAVNAIGTSLTAATTGGIGFMVAGPAGAIAGALIGGIGSWLFYYGPELKKKIDELMKKAGEWVGEKKLQVGIFVDDVKKKVSDAYDKAQKWWDKKPDLKEVKFKFADLKKSLNDLWKKSLEWWDKRPKLKDVDFKLSDLKGSVKKAYENTMAWWNSKPNLKEVSFKWQDLKKAIQDLWSNVKSWWNGKGELAKILFPNEDLRSKIAGVWNGVVSWWGQRTGLSKVSFQMDSLSSLLQNAWASARNWWNNRKPSLSNIEFKIKMPRIVLKWDYYGWKATIFKKLGFPGFPNFDVEFFKDGGFPVPGSYFVAGENGIPEMLGTVGGKSAVASGAEITGIRDAVYSTSQTEIALLRRQNELLQQLVDKRTEVNIGDREIAKANNRGQKMLGAKLITEI